MELLYRNGLLFLSLKIVYKGKEKVIENIVVDTGASETIISPDVVEDIKINAELDDNIGSYYGVGGSIHNFFTKKIDEIIIDKVLLKQVKVDFGVVDPKGKINGLLGLDLLQKAHSVIDLKNMMMTVEQ